MNDATPVNPQPRELEIIKVLFDRHLSNRAVALAESRWPGSGAMIRLAYDWEELSPEVRREKISEIGPDDLARLKSLAALNPELKKVIEDLDSRGVLPHLEEAALSGTAAAGAVLAEEPVDDRVDLVFGAPAEDNSFDVDALAAEPLSESDNDIDSGSVGEPLPEERSAETSLSPEPEIEPATSARITERLNEIEEIVNEYDLENFSFEDLKVEMPNLDSGLPSTKEVLADRESHRQEAVARADAAMERVRLQLDQTAARAVAPATPFVSSATSPPDLPPITGFPELEDVAIATLPTEQSRSVADKSSIAVPPEWLVQAVADSVVTTVPRDRHLPSSEELVALANQLDLELSEFTVEPGKTRSVFGGLVHTGTGVDVSVGPLPLAMASSSLVVVYGRLFEKMVNRLLEGYCDLPGTRSTVRLHESTRVVIIPG